MTDEEQRVVEKHRKKLLLGTINDYKKGMVTPQGLAVYAQDPDPDIRAAAEARRAALETTQADTS